ncbi:hypothetical protein [Hymenobacter sp. AT01-02]|uniref:hypothetical protein n=1 Tax=Hymenobacter sp. AT01-02 TaxID=1571877 RepID=UPI00092F8B11|nr:hypothetical protein [Hymenobacter sp. AT01-02]
MGTALAAYIVELASHQSFPDFTACYLTRPLRLRDSAGTSTTLLSPTIRGCTNRLPWRFRTMD